MLCIEERIIEENKFVRSWMKRIRMKCPQGFNSLVLLQFVIVSVQLCKFVNSVESVHAVDKEIDKRRRFNTI